MTLLHFDGFDHYGDDETKMTEGVYDSIESDFSLSSSNPRTGIWHTRRNSTASDSYITKALIGDHQGLGTGAAFYLSALPTSENSYPVFDFMYNSIIQLSCVIQPDGSIDIKIGGINGAIVASSDTGLVKAGEFFHLEFAAYPDSVTDTFSAFFIQRKEQWKNIIEDELSTNDYSDPDFDDSSWSTDPAPFWEQDENPILLPLGWNISGGTPIPDDSLVWMRRSFFLPTSATIDFVIAVDDFYNFYIDGILVSETASSPSVGVFEFSVSLSAGSHVIAAQIVDLPDPTTGPTNYFYADMETDNVIYGQVENGGIVEVRLNGVTVISKSNVITTNSTSKAYNKVRLACGSSNSHGITTDIDDWYIWDDQGSWNNSFLGDRRCYFLKPNQDTNIADFEPSSGGFGYKMINDESPDDDSSYIIAEAYLQSGSPLAGTSEFEIENLDNGSSLISGINIVTRAAKTDSTSAEVCVSINSGANSLSASSHVLTTSYTYYNDIFEYDPSSVASLTRDVFNSISVSITADDLNFASGIESPDDGSPVLVGSPTDSDLGEFLDSVVSLLHFENTDASTIFTDESGVEWLPRGQAQIDTANPKFGSSALLMDGTGDGIYTRPVDLDFYTQDWTIEGFIFADTLNNWIFGAAGNTLTGVFNATGGIHVLITSGSTGLIQIQMSDGTSTPATATSSSSISTGVYTYLAVSYVSSTNTAYFSIDGVVESVALNKSVSKPSLSPRLFYGNLTSSTSTTDSFDGHIDEGRFTLGVARYTSNHSVPSIEFSDNIPDFYFGNVVSLLHFDGADASTTFTDVIGNTYSVLNNAQIDTDQSKFGGSSGLFDGTTDAIFAADDPSLRMGASDFTCEMWFYASSAGAGTNRGLCTKRNSNATFKEFSIFIDSANKLEFLASTNGTSWGMALVDPSTITHDVWIHVACTRDGNTYRLFKDGSLVASTTHSGTLSSSTENFTIGALGSNGDFSMNGWIDDFRLTKGVARYTKQFDVPTSAFKDN